MFANLSLKWKVLALALAGPIIVALVLSVHQVFQIRSDAEASIVKQSRAVVLMAESAREEMAKKLQMGLTIPFDQIDSQEKLLEAIPVITAINMAKRKAEELQFKFRVPKVAPRNPANKPTPLEKSVLDEFKNSKLTEKIIVENHQIRYFRPIRLTQECLYCHGDNKGDLDPTGGVKEGWKVGEVHGAFEIITSLETAKAQILKAEIFAGGRNRGHPASPDRCRLVPGPLGHREPALTASATFARAVADGDLKARPEGHFAGELGVVENAISTMVGNLENKMKETAEKQQEAEEAKGVAERAMEEARAQESQGRRAAGQDATHRPRSRRHRRKSDFRSQ